MNSTQSYTLLPLEVLPTIVLFFLLFVIAGAQPANTKVLEIHPTAEQNQNDRYNILDFLYILPDSSGTWTIEDISTTAFNARFQAGQAQKLYQNQPDLAHYWVRFSVDSRLENPQQWLLNLSLPKVTLFTPQPDGSFTSIRSGTYLPFSQRHLQGQYGSLPYLTVDLPQAQSQTYFLRVKPGALPLGHPSWRHQLNGILASKAHVTQFEIKNRTFLNLIFGLFLAVALYHLIFFIYNRQPAFLYFGLSVFFNFLLSIYFAGFAHELFFQEYPIFNNDFLFYVSNGGFIGFLLLFSSHYLNLKQLLPKWNKVLLGMVGLLIVYNGGMMLLRLVDGPAFYRNEIPSVQLYTLYVILIYIFILLAAVLCVRKGFRPAIIFLIAIGLLVSQNLVNVLAGIGLVPFPQFMTGDKGAALGLILFAIGLGQQFKRMQIAKVKAESMQKKEQEESNRLRELDTFKSRFYTNITHEFRTPLTVIQGIADQIRENPKWKTEEQTALIKRNSGKMLDLINQMLDLSKLEAGKLEVQNIQADVVKYLGYLVESFHSLAFSQKVNLTFYSPIEKLVMDYDPEKYQRIISNLISNAIKFTPAYGKITVAIKELSQEDDTRWLEIKVVDSGTGIPKDELPFIFDRFYQVDDSSIRKGEGTGLGLALVKELVELMQGKISVSSQPGKGTQFTLLLPIQNQAEPQEIEALKEQSESGQSYWSVATDQAWFERAPSDLPIVLIVEDNADVIYYLRKCLEGQYQLKLARDGRQGIEMALEIIPDLVVSDVMMPEVDGFELCETLKNDERTSHIPIVLLTAKVTQDAKVQGLTLGADAYLTKPFEKQELLVRLEKLIESRKQLQAYYQKADGKTENPEHAFMKKVWAIVNTNLDNADYSVVNLSRDLGMSRAQVHRKLKALTDLSASQYIRLVRLNKARSLLRETELTIAEISYEVGFKSPSHFTRVFSQHFGESPSETRK